MGLHITDEIQSGDKPGLRAVIYYVSRQHVKPALLFRKRGLRDPLSFLFIEKLQKRTRRNPLSHCSHPFSHDNTHTSLVYLWKPKKALSALKNRHTQTHRESQYKMLCFQASLRNSRSKVWSMGRSPFTP